MTKRFHHRALRFQTRCAILALVPTNEQTVGEKTLWVHQRTSEGSFCNSTRTFA